MTLMDLCRIIRKQWLLIVVVTAVCAALGIGYMLFTSSSSADSENNSAVSRIVVNSNVAAVAGLASSEARQQVEALPEDQREEFEAATKPDGNTMTVAIT